MGRRNMGTALVGGLLACVGLVALVGCGGSGGTTTVIEKAARPKTVVQAAKTVKPNDLG
jgi:uncharacterized protein (UPF0261 family)